MTLTKTHRLLCGAEAETEETRLSIDFFLVSLNWKKELSKTRSVVQRVDLHEKRGAKSERRFNKTANQNKRDVSIRKRARAQKRVDSPI